MPGGRKAGVRTGLRPRWHQGQGQDWAAPGGRKVGVRIGQTMSTAGMAAWSTAGAFTARATVQMPVMQGGVCMGMRMASGRVGITY